MSKFVDKLTIDQYGKIRFAKEFVFQKKPEIALSGDKKRVWFLDAPAYGNLGDQVIAYAINRFCKSLLPSFEMLEFQEESVIQYLSWLKKNVKKGDVIVLQGGGDLGNLYPRYEFIRRTVIRAFPENRMIVFPQSIFFSEDTAGKYELDCSRKVYEENQRLVIFARDSVSYAKMKRAFPKTKIELCPDVVFSLNGLVETELRSGFGICMRDDREKTVTDKQLTEIIGEVKLYSKEKKIFDTVIEVSRPVIDEYRESLVLSKLREFAGCEMVLTDRLHGMIFSYITSTPCIAFANSTGKSQYAYNDWLSMSKNVAFVSDKPNSLCIPKSVASKDLDFSSLKEALLSETGE